MTVVGKILVFVNLVFGLLAGGLLMVDFIARSNYAAAEKQARDQNEVLRAALTQTETEKRSLETKVAAAEQAQKNAVLALARDKKEEADKLQAAGVAEFVRQAVADREKAEAALRTAEALVAKYQQATVKDSADTAAVQKASEARKDQITELAETNKKLRDDNLKLIEDANNERRERIRARIEARTLEKTNEDLVEQVKDLAKELARSKAGLTTTTLTSRKRGEDNPPPEQIEGRITQLYRDRDLVQISVGSDNGLLQGHTLKVFRLDRVPENSKFLGVIEIVSVRPHEAVGRLVRRTAYEVQKGDRVASRIGLGGN